MVTTSVLSYEEELSEITRSPMTTASVNITYNNDDIQGEFQTTMQENFNEPKPNSKGT